MVGKGEAVIFRCVVYMVGKGEAVVIFRCVVYMVGKGEAVVVIFRYGWQGRGVVVIFRCVAYMVGKGEAVDHVHPQGEALISLLHQGKTLRVA